jgi:hypothetical protein
MHTPGPWTAKSEEFEEIWSMVVGKETMIAEVFSRKPEADARLIAAAPELLEALEGIIEIGKRDMSNEKYDGYFESARAAITKARGDV